MSFAKRTGFPIGIITHSTATGSARSSFQKPDDWGWLAGKLVAVDYATRVNANPGSDFCGRHTIALTSFPPDPQ